MNYKVSKLNSKYISNEEKKEDIFDKLFRYNCNRSESLESKIDFELIFAVNYNLGLNRI